MGSKHFTEGAGGNAAVDAVDVDLLFLVIFTHGLLLLHLWDWSAGHIHTRTYTRAQTHTRVFKYYKSVSFLSTNQPPAGWLERGDMLNARLNRGLKSINKKNDIFTWILKVTDSRVGSHTKRISISGF